MIVVAGRHYIKFYIGHDEVESLENLVTGSFERGHEKKPLIRRGRRRVNSRIDFRGKSIQGELLVTTSIQENCRQILLRK